MSGVVAGSLVGAPQRLKSWMKIFFKHSNSIVSKKYDNAAKHND
jgi:hypothetical protein